MRYREIVNEELGADVQGLVDQSKKWGPMGPEKKFDVDIGTIGQWLRVMRQSGEDRTPPNLNDNLLLVGLVGDPKFRDKSRLAKADEAFSILNQYKPGEKIDANTRTRLMYMYRHISGNQGQFIPDLGNDWNSWNVRLLHDTQDLIDGINKSVNGLVKADVVAHESMHRGCEVWGLLLKNGLISPSAETQFVLRESRVGGNIQANGEHALIYNKLRKSGPAQYNYVEPWAEKNKRELNAKFGLGDSSFNDRYVDLTNDREITDYYKQIKLWLDIVYDKASDEIGSYLGKKFIESPRPRTKPGTGSTPYDGKSQYAKPLKNRQQFQDLLIRTLAQLKADRSQRTESGKQQFRSKLIAVSGANQPKQLKIIDLMANELWRNTDGLTAKNMQYGVNMLYDDE